MLALTTSLGQAATVTYQSVIEEMPPDLDVGMPVVPDLPTAVAREAEREISDRIFDATWSGYYQFGQPAADDPRRQMCPLGDPSEDPLVPGVCNMTTLAMAGVVFGVLVLMGRSA